MIKRFFYILLFLPTLSFALGDLAHNYVAEQAAKQITNAPKLQGILTNYQNSYLIGSAYPDTGYVSGFHFGEDSHWPYFLKPFATYIHDNYANSKTTAAQTHRDKLIAFLLGISTHVKSDIVSHWTYYNYVALHDFGSKDHDAWSKAHSVMDPASDFYVIVRKGIYNHPIKWWVPVADLVNIYAIMKKNNIIKETVTAKEIIDANAIYYFELGLTEDLVAYPVYAYDAYYKIPWGIKHLDDPNPQYGAFPEMIHQSSDYIQTVWKAIQGQSTIPTIRLKNNSTVTALKKITHVVEYAVKNNWLTITPQIDQFGDVTFDTHSIHFKSNQTKSLFQAQLKTATLNK